MKLFQKRNGSITIFLSIILVPTLLFSSIMVDGAAFVLSKGMVESAGELATNGALADYDTILKEVYGLFAMSQKAENPQDALKKNVTDYFENSLKANGIIPQGVDWDSNTANWIGDLLDNVYGIDDASIPALVKASVTDDTTVSYIDNSSLANPQILRSQIVEYAKYRAPLNAALSAIDSFGAFKKVDQQTKVIEEKTKVDEKLEKTNSKLKDMYDKVKKFDEEVAELQHQLDSSAARDFTYKDIDTAMKLIHSIIVNLEIEPLITNDTGSNYVGQFNDAIYVGDNGILYSLNLDSSERIVDVNDVWATRKGLDEIKGHYNDTVGNINTIMSELSGHTPNVLGYATFSGMTRDQPYNTSSTSNPTKLKEAMEKYRTLGVQFIELWKTIKSIEHANAPAYGYPQSVYNVTVIRTEEMTQRQFDALYEAAVNEKKREHDSDMEDEFNRNKENLKQNLTSNLTNYIAFCDNYKNAMNRYQSTFMDKDKLLRVKLVKLRTLLCPVAVAASKFDNDIRISWNWLKTSAGTSSKLALDSIEEAKQAIIVLKNQAKVYEGSVNSYQTGNKDEFAATMQADVKKILELYDENDLDDIKEQINSILNYVTSSANPVGVIEALDSVQLSGESIVVYGESTSKDIPTINGLLKTIVEKYKVNGVITGQWPSIKNGNYKNFDNNTISVIGNAKFAESVLHQLCTDSYNKYNKYNTTKHCYLKKISESGVKTADGNTVSIPAFYYYLITLFGKPADTSSGLDDSKIKTLNKDSEEMTGGTETGETSKYAYSSTLLDSVPSGTNVGEGGNNNKEGGGTFSFFSNAANTFSEIFSALGNLNGENIIDTMLVSEYVLNDFSIHLDTLVDDEGETEGNDNKPRATYSNVPINKENNKMYGCEVEYILYGRKGNVEKKFLWFTTKDSIGPEANVDQAKQNIFAVRLVFNMVFAMSNARLDKETLTPALSIQAATGGIFPYQVAQTIIKLALAMAESNSDVGNIMKGEKMPLMKTEESWKFKLSHLVTIVTDYAKTELQGKIEEIMVATQGQALSILQTVINEGVENFTDYQDKMREEMLDMARGGVEDIVNAMTQSYTNAIESYYTQILTEGKEYSLEGLKASCKTAVEQYMNNSNVDARIQEVVLNDLIIQLDTMLASGSKMDKYFKKITEEMIATDINAEVLANNYYDVMNSLSEQAIGAIDAVDDKMDEISEEIGNKVTEATAEVVSQLQAKGDACIEDVSAQIAGTVNGKLNDIFPSNTINTGITLGEEDSSVVSGKGITMGYKDYIRVFLLVKLLSDSSDQVVTRIADVIQVNVNEGLAGYKVQHPKKGTFKMASAYTYFEIDAKVKVEPVLISQDWFEDFKGDKIEYLNYNYHTIAGY